MNPYNEELMRYQQDAEDQFDDYYSDDMDYDEEDAYDSMDDLNDDDYEYDDEDDFDGYYEEEEEDYDDYIDDDMDYDDFSNKNIGRINPNDRTLTVVISNTGAQASEAILFGANAEEAQPNGVSVIVEESSHKEVREESKANPFRIAGMKYSVSSALQFDNVLRIQRRTASGTSTNRVYQPRNATSPQNFTQSLIDDDNFEMDVTGQDSLRLVVNPGVTAVFTFTVKARANLGNILKGNNVAELSRVPRTTGLPQLDLLRRKRPTALGLAARPVRRRRRKSRFRKRGIARPYRGRPRKRRPSKRKFSRLVRRKRS